MFRIVLDGGTIFHPIYIDTLHSVLACGNGIARTSVATSKVYLLSGAVQGWSDKLGGHDRGSRSTQMIRCGIITWTAVYRTFKISKHG